MSAIHREELKVRVYAEYSDGRYTLVLWTSEHEDADLPYVEILESEWREYVSHMASDREWQRFLCDLDNDLFHLHKRLRLNHLKNTSRKVKHGA